MKMLIVAGVALALAGCQTVKVSLDPSVPPPQAPIDQKIAKISEELAKQCALLATGIVLVQTFKPDLKEQLKLAEAARSAFCAKPPTDVNTAIATVAAMAIAVNTALQEKEVTP